MEGEAVAVSAPGRWGTWEELLLGGAVLRHGTRDWELVASELRSRILCPCDLTPQVCKEKYQDLRCRFSGCTAWFEELRKQRMEELRQALERSESSIGSLESKLKTLKAEKGETNYVDYDSSRTVSLEPVQKPAQFQRETLKDGILSSSSFTPETSANWSTEEVLETKPNVFGSTEKARDPRIGMLGDFCLGQVAGCIRKRRGKRKRKDCGREVKEGSVGDSDFIRPMDVVAESLESKETSTSDNGSAKCDNLDPRKGGRKEGPDDLMSIFYSVMEHGSIHIFLHRLEGQKRVRYRRLIRRHMDLETIKTKLMNRSTTSSMELFRDLLLLANNALVFYPNNTREYKSALLLRDVINRTMSQESNKGSTMAETVLEETDAPPKAKARSSLLNNQKSQARRGTARRSRKASDSDYSVPSAGSTAMERRNSGGPRRGRRGGSSQRSVNPGRGRKQARTK